MAENLGMFDEIDPLSQISETDPRQWQMEWMDNYMATRTAPLVRK